MRGNILILMTLALLAACSEDPAETEKPEKAPEAAEQTGDQAKNDDKADADGKTEDADDAEAGNGDEADEAGDDDDAAEGETRDKSKDESKERADEDQQARAPDVIYDRFCVACHGEGMAGAPKLGDAEPWDKRLDERGLDGLVKNSVEGYNAMPAQGTCMDCTEEEMQATVEWMLDESGVEY